MNRFGACLLLFVLSSAELASAQSLAEVAKREAERRKSIAVRGRVYTNSDLKAEPSSPPGGPDSVPQVSDTEATREPPAPTEEKGQAYWKALIGSARAALERSRVLAAALQSRLNALAADIAARDDPAQRSKLEADRRRVQAELDHVNVEIADQTRAIATIEEDARKAGVAPGWLR